MLLYIHKEHRNKTETKKKGKKDMGERALENRVNKLRELEAQKEALEAQIDKVKAEIKKDMETKGVDEIKTNSFTIRWKEIASNKFDSTSFKKQYAEMYKLFTKKTVSKRFTIV